MTFTGAIFGEGAIFANATFKDTGFTRARFGIGADFTDAQFGDDAHFDGAIFGNGADFGRARFGNRASFPNTRFGDSASFTAARFGERAFFGGTSFGPGVLFPRTVFGDRAILGGRGAGLMLKGAIFDNADLAGASLRGSDLQSASFREAHLERADLTDVLLAGADLRQACFDYRTSLEGARLFTDGEGKETSSAPWLGDVRWNGVPVSGVADWEYATDARVGEDPFQTWPLSLTTWTKNALSRSVEWMKGTRLWRWVSRAETGSDDHMVVVDTATLVSEQGTFLVDVDDPDAGILPIGAGTVVRANRQVATLLRAQGIVLEVDDFGSDDLVSRQLGQSRN